MTEVLEKLSPLEVWVPDQHSIVYPGNDAWLELETGATDPGADPAWTQIEQVPPTASIPNKTVTAQGANPPSTSTATSVFGGASLLCPNLAGVALQTPDHADWYLAGGDFTIEGRYYLTVVRKALYAQMTTGGGDRSWELTMDVGTDLLTFSYAYEGGAGGAGFDVDVSWPFVPALSQWYHIAVVRFGTVLRGFVNGAQVGTDHAIGTRVIRNSAAPLTINGDARSAGANDFRGYVDELRISKGIARWTGTSFTVPTAAYTRDNNTVLLMHFDGPDGGTAYTDSSGSPGTSFDPGSDPAWVQIER